MTRRQFLDGLQAGSPVRIEMGARGVVLARIIAIYPRQIHAKFGREVRRFSREDGGTFQAPTHSKSWLMPVEE